MRNTRNMRKALITAAMAATAACALAQSSKAQNSKAQNVKAQEDAKWTWSGWGGGGFFWSAAWDTQDENTLYMGGDVVGIYKSSDKGKSWKFVNNGLQNYGVYTLAVAKSNPKVVYAMTENGIARSDNSGDSWKRLPETMNASKRMSTARHQTVRGIAIDPKNPMTVYAGSGRGELHKSVDGGETWAQLDFLSAMPQDGAGGDAKVPRGRGFLFMRHAGGGDWGPHARVEKFFGEAAAEDWSAFSRVSAKFLAPVGAPKNLTAEIVVQNGADWKWQQDAQVTLKPGEWVEASFDLSKVANIKDVRMVHLVVRSYGTGFSGDIGIDDVALTTGAGAAGKERVIGNWEVPGDLDGWRKPTAADARYTKELFSSLKPAPNISAPIGTVAIADADPSLIFVAHRRLGLFRSADGGKTWTRPQTPADASSIAIYPKNPKIIYGAFAKDGVWKSADAGVTWQKLEGSVPANHGITEIVIDPRDSNIVHYIAAGNWSGIYGTTRDGGKTWQTGRKWTRDAHSNATRSDEKTGGGELSTPTNLAISPTNPDLLVISANWTNIMSYDGGKTWIQRDTGADITCFHDFRFAGNSIFAAAMDEGLFRSDDNGKTWRVLAPKQYKEGLSGHQWRVLAQPNKSGDFRIVSTVSAWRGAKEYPNYVIISEDGGKTFAEGREGLPDYLSRNHTMWEHSFARALAADPNDPQILYMGIDGAPEEGKTGGGIFKSADGGYTWKQLPSQPESRCMFYGLAVDPKNSKRIYWGAGDQGNKTGKFGVWVSEDGGDSWQKTEVNEWVFNVETSPSGDAVYAGGNNLWQSLDSGKTWKKITNFGLGGNIVGIAVDPANEKRIWCSAVNWGGDDTGGVFRSEDGGKTWVEITGDIPYRRPLVLRYNASTRELWAAGVGAFKTPQ